MLVVHSDAKHKEQALADLDTLDAPDSPYRSWSGGNAQGGLGLQEGLRDRELRASVSEVLTEQTLGRGLRLPFGEYVEERPLLNKLDVLAHERYEELLRRSKALTETFVDHRTWLAERTAAEATPATSDALVQAPVVEGTTSAGAQETTDDAAAATPGGVVLLGTTEDRLQDAEQQAAAADVELQPVTRTPPIEVPVMEVHALPVEFSLKQVTDEAPFRDLGHRLAVDPDYTLKRTRLDALVSVDAITGTRGTSWHQTGRARQGSRRRDSRRSPNGTRDGAQVRRGKPLRAES